MKIKKVRDEKSIMMMDRVTAFSVPNSISAECFLRMEDFLIHWGITDKSGPGSMIRACQQAVLSSRGGIKKSFRREYAVFKLGLNAYHWENKNFFLEFLLGEYGQKVMTMGSNQEKSRYRRLVAALESDQRGFAAMKAIGKDVRWLDRRIPFGKWGFKLS